MEPEEWRERSDELEASIRRFYDDAHHEDDSAPADVLADVLDRLADVLDELRTKLREECRSSERRVGGEPRAFPRFVRPLASLAEKCLQRAASKQR